MKRLLHIIFLILFFTSLTFTGLALAQNGGGVKKKRPLPHEYGRMIIGNYKELWPVREPSVPVVFDHWLHRARFTCRLCHVDIAFGMVAGTTGIKASDNIKGYYCGTCHNGEMVYNGRKVFDSCSENFQKEDIERCIRCHSLGKNVKREYDFYTFTEKLPRERFGNGIDWEKAEAEGLIKLIDFLEGVSIKSFSLEASKDFEIEAKIEGIPNVIFSHKKHTVWNGCEVCHPDIFFVKKGITKFTCVNNFEGKYCGACHRTVAFPMLDCQRCHTKPVY